MTNALIVQNDGDVLRLTLNRPDVRNALNEQLIVELTNALRDVARASDIRAVVITGSGGAVFCAGADLTPNAKTFDSDYSRPTTVYADLLRTAYHLPVPLIGRINGHCMAGGMGLLAVCDLAVSSADARFGLPEVKVGMFPLQVAALLQSIVPARKFAEMCFTGEPISASEALEIGLINYVVDPPELDRKLVWLVERVTSKSPTAIRRGKHALRVTAGLNFDQALSHMETQIGLLALTEDAKEGLAAFSEKRPPEWSGR
jgi:methylglutaconyl-CoA hydratase